MVVKANDTQKREFMGVSFDLLSVGKETMVTKMNYKAGEVIDIFTPPRQDYL